LPFAHSQLALDGHSQLLLLSLRKTQCKKDGEIGASTPNDKLKSTTSNKKEKEVLSIKFFESLKKFTKTGLQSIQCILVFPLITN